jgi:hypothetical protein
VQTSLSSYFKCFWVCPCDKIEIFLRWILSNVQPINNVIPFTGYISCVVFFTQFYVFCPILKNKLLEFKRYFQYSYFNVKTFCMVKNTPVYPFLVYLINKFLKKLRGTIICKVIRIFHPLTKTPNNKCITF